MPRRGVALALVLVAAGSAADAGAITVPAGFQDAAVATGLAEPAVLAFAPDGRLFIGEKASGKIEIHAAGDAPATVKTFLDLNQVVPAGTQFDSYYERGLLGIAFDPGFATNGFVYVYHTLCKQPQGGGCAAGGSKNRVIRVHASGDVADGAPTVIVDDIDSDAGNHNAGWIDFGPSDGKLYVATGDGGADHAKSQRLDSLSGKILRLEPDGAVPADNPFAGSPTIRGEIWASGLRNPWRCRFRADGRLLCGDVGQDTWEELDVVFPGADYGWPTTSDGPFTLAQFPAFTPPIFAYAHGGAGAAIMAGDFGAKTTFPGDYAQSFFYGDFVLGVIRQIGLDATATAVTAPASDFATDIGANQVTDVVAGPGGALYYTRYDAGEVRKVAFVAANHSPVAVAGATGASGDAPLTVTFSSAGSSDADGDPLTFTWDFGDGQGAVGASPVHQYQQRGAYVATLTVSDGMASPGPGFATVAVTVGHPPQVTIAQPLDGAHFDAGSEIALVGGATDAEDGAIAAAALTWKIVFRHADHTHPFIDARAGSPTSFTTADSGETDPDVGYEIVLSATDSDDMTGSASVLLIPNTVTMTFTSVPVGASIALDGTPHATPFMVTSVVGMQRTIAAVGAPGLAFSSWSDGGDATHVISAPAAPTTLSASFTTVPTPTPTATVPVATPTPLGLADAAAARAATACQRTIAQSALALLRTSLAALGRCGNALQACVHTRTGDATCPPKARATCAKAESALAAASARMQASVTRRCATAGDVMAGLGLGYSDVAPDCAASGDPAADVAGLAACVARRQRCTAERLFGLAVPRAGELLRVGGVPPAPGSCIADRGGSGTPVTPAAATALTRCAATIAKAAGAFAAGRAVAGGDCATSLFGCAQRRTAADVAACVANADASCARAADATAAVARLRAAIDKRCGAGLLPYATLRAAAAANLDALAGDCAAEGVADVGTLAGFESCLVHQHACLAAALVRTAVPRAADLLALLGRTLGPADCPPPGAPPQ